MWDMLWIDEVHLRIKLLGENVAAKLLDVASCTFG